MVVTQPTILAVDDDRGLLGLYETWLTPEYTVRTATDGREALDEIDEAVEVVVIDRDMPRLTGDQCLRRCRRRGWDCRVVMVSASEPDGAVLELGFDAYLQKPIERRKLLDHVSMLLRRQPYSESVKRYLATLSKIALVDEAARHDGGREAYERLEARRRRWRSEAQEALDGVEQRAVEAEVRQVTGLGAAD